jgi:hypothetical protein
MIATAKLRFVERTVQVPFQDYKDVTESKIVPILQQWWDNPYDFGDDTGEPRVNGEWRDVPIEKEPA